MRVAAVLSVLLLVGCTAQRWLLDWDLREPRALAFFDCTDPAVFTVHDGVLELTGPAAYDPPHRSPTALAIARGPDLGDFTLTVQAQQTGREYPHRDLVIVFGWRDPAHFVYAHLASRAEDTSHHVMLVDGADRRPVTTWRTDGVAWGEGWHDLRVVRRGTDVEVSFDGEPVLRATAPAWRGRIGVGSFDDTGRFRALALHGDGRLE